MENEAIPKSFLSPNSLSKTFMFLFISIQIDGHFVKKNSTTKTFPKKSSLLINKLSWFLKIKSGTFFFSPFNFTKFNSLEKFNLVFFFKLSLSKRSIIFGKNQIPNIKTTNEIPTYEYFFI